MSNKQSIGPYIFGDEAVTQQNYLQMLKNYFYLIMQRKRLNNKIIFQQDDTPFHSSKVRTWLDEKFNGRWIGRAGPISLAPRSPDLAPLNFFLCRYIKTKVYKTNINDITD